MNYLTSFLIEWDRFLILLARLTGISFIPLFNTRNIPIQWRVFFLMSLTFNAWLLGFADDFTVNLQLPAYVMVITEVLHCITGIGCQFFCRTISRTIN